MFSGALETFSKVIGWIYFLAWTISFYPQVWINFKRRSVYLPQAYFNCIRKSTVGWSIENILLDCTGGTLSIMQMFLIAKNYNEFGSVLGNPTKLLLGLFSVLFDIFFMVQHFVLFRHPPDEESEVLIEEEETHQQQPDII
ncbi:hypothetical protein Ciccas_012415 [Cichlidogyrus casuarinus]|uniref:Cystinosin n=1 Tax=Cichlidogyrus casuarinus TaxID=1844966 RepID=A0ABD2PNG0_9PLAT